MGRELTRAAFEQIGKRSTEKALSIAAKELNLNNVSHLLELVGSTDLSSKDVVNAIYPDLVSKSKIDRSYSKRSVIGLPKGVQITRSRCCLPLPGERIVGIKHKGDGVFVHSIDCGALTEIDRNSDRWVDVHWDTGKHQASNTVTLNLTIVNDSGVLGRLCTLIGEQRANISDLHFLDRKPDYFRILIDVDVSDSQHLHSIMVSIEADSYVAALERHRDINLKPN